MNSQGVETEEKKNSRKRIVIKRDTEKIDVSLAGEPTEGKSPDETFIAEFKQYLPSP